MIAARLSLPALLLVMVAASVSGQGLAVLAAGVLAKGVAAGGLAKSAATAAGVATGAAATAGAAKGGLSNIGQLLGKKEESEKKKESENSSEASTSKSQDKSQAKPSTGVAHKHKEGFLGVQGPNELFQLMLNPFELCAKIAEHFKLHFDKFFPAVSKGVNFGLELAVQPFVLSLKIVEKVFVPDACKLKFACKLAHTFSFTKEIMPKLSDKVLNESKLFKALSDGIHSDCEVIYHCDGNPKIKADYKEHHKGHHHEQHHGGDKHHHEGGGKHDEHKHGDHKHEGHKHDDYKHEGHGEGQHHDETYGEGRQGGEGQHEEGNFDESHEDEYHEPEWSASSQSKTLKKKSE